MPSSWVSPIAFILQCFFSLWKSRSSCFHHRNVNESYGFYSQFPWWLQSDLADCTNTHTHTLTLAACWSRPLHNLQSHAVTAASLTWAQMKNERFWKVETETQTSNEKFIASSVLRWRECESQHCLHTSCGYILRKGKERERAGDEDWQIKSKSDPALWDDFISSVPCSDFLPKDNRAFADDSFLKQQRDQCWVACGFLRKNSQNAVCTCVRVLPVVAAQGDKETHSGPVWLMYYFRYSQSSHSRHSPEFGNCSHAVGEKNKCSVTRFI